MSTEVQVNLSYDTLPSIPISYSTQQRTILLSLKFRFNYKYETTIRDGHGRPIVITTDRDHISPCFSCPIPPQLMARDQNPSSLFDHLLNELNSYIPDVNDTSRRYMAQTIANSLKSTRVFPLCQVRADVEIVQYEHSWIHHPHPRHQQQQQPTVDGDVEEGIVVEGVGTGASKSTLDKLMEKGRFYYEHKCSICWEKYRDGIEVIKMPNCLHVFHQQCIFQWLKTKNSCPLCRDTL